MRHGRTEWNAQNKLQGRTDIPLNDDGRKMAEQVREECRKLGFDVCYTSPLIRAKETAEIALKGLNVPIIADDRLVEMCFGICEGMENYFEDENLPVNVLFKNPELYKAVENGEELSDLFARTGDFIENVLKPQLDEERKILIVGHGAMNCSIISQIKKIPVENFWKAGIPNCKLIKLL